MARGDIADASRSGTFSLSFPLAPNVEGPGPNEREAGGSEENWEGPDSDDESFTWSRPSSPDPFEDEASDEDDDPFDDEGYMNVDFEVPDNVDGVTDSDSALGYQVEQDCGARPQRRQGQGKESRPTTPTGGSTNLQGLRNGRLDSLAFGSTVPLGCSGSKTEGETSLPEQSAQGFLNQTSRADRKTSTGLFRLGSASTAQEGVEQSTDSLQSTPSTDLTTQQVDGQSKGTPQQTVYKQGPKVKYPVSEQGDTRTTDATTPGPTVGSLPLLEHITRSEGTNTQGSGLAQKEGTLEQMEKLDQNDENTCVANNDDPNPPVVDLSLTQPSTETPPIAISKPQPTDDETLPDAVQEERPPFSTSNLNDLATLTDALASVVKTALDPFNHALQVLLERDRKRDERDEKVRQEMRIEALEKRLESCDQKRGNGDGYAPSGDGPHGRRERAEDRTRKPLRNGGGPYATEVLEGQRSRHRSSQELTPPLHQLSFKEEGEYILAYSPPTIEEASNNNFFPPLQQDQTTWNRPRTSLQNREAFNPEVEASSPTREELPDLDRSMRNSPQVEQSGGWTGNWQGGTSEGVYGSRVDAGLSAQVGGGYVARPSREDDFRGGPTLFREAGRGRHLRGGVSRYGTRGPCGGGQLWCRRCQ